MPKKAKELGALDVGRLIKPGYHFVGGVAGLILQVSDTGARSWILRATVGGKRRDIGLGGFPDVTLAGAKEAARSARAKILAGVDPIEERRAANAALIAAHRGYWPAISERQNTPLSDMTLTAVLRRMGRGDVTAHGFRSSFRDWAGEVGVDGYDRATVRREPAGSAGHRSRAARRHRA